MSRLRAALRAARARYGVLTARTNGALSTGCAEVDAAIGGGVPCGQLTELFGPPACGKTTLALHLAASGQQSGTVAFIDADRSLDPERAERIGVCPPDLLICQPVDGRQAMAMVERLASSGVISLVIVDSVMSLSAGERTPSEVLSAHLPSLRGIAQGSGAAIVFLNQLGHRPGIRWGQGLDAPIGDALKFHCALRIAVEPRSALFAHGAPVGTRLRVRAIKTRGVPAAEVTLDLHYTSGRVSTV